jgi:predicted O-linked N-acetylglucosamine transferase (SPINDLY family)/predicted SAM-dependent methyltransferase
MPQPVTLAQQLINHAQQLAPSALVLTDSQQAGVSEYGGAELALHKVSAKSKKNGKPTVTEMNALATLFNRGDLTESEQLATAITQRYPQHGFGWKVLGAIRQQQGLIDEAFQALKNAAELLPNDSEANYNLGNCFYDQNQLEEAVVCYQKAVRIDSGFAKAHFNLGSVLQKQGCLEQAEASYRKALKFDPNNAVIHFNLAQILSEQGRFSEAVNCYQQGLKIQPDLAAAHVNLGVAFKAMGQMQEAEACNRTALNINPDHVEAYNNLSVLFLEQGRIAEAEVCCKKALEINPDYIDAYNNLGLILHGMGRFSEAEAAFERALEYDPDRVLVYSNFSVFLKAQGQITRAESYLRKAIEINPGYINSYTNLITVLLDQGRVREAITISLHALQIQPDCLKTRSNLLFSMNYSGSHSADECLEQARQYGRVAVGKVGGVFTSWLHDPQAKRLRVGLVSGDFCQHAVAYFLENLVQHIDPSNIELIAYPTENREDVLTTRLKPYFSAWKPLVGLNDQAAAQLIHSDGLHVLLDLSGHTARNRLPVLAWKPAPVQVSWLGYFATTGVEAMDYFLADEVGVPEVNQAQFTEKIKYLPDTRLCFTAPGTAIDVSPLPALANGYITFGCFQNMAKVGDDVLDLWAEIMSALPNTKLRWQCQSFGDAVITESVVQRLTQHGFDLDRVTLTGSTSREDYLAAHAEIDVILDTFPFPGGTTTCEALWMGVPTLTLAGNTLIARQGASLLTAAGLGDWVADNRADYIRKVSLFTGDLGNLAKLRAGLREQVLVSPLFDAPRFARNMETALWGMWNDSQSGRTKQKFPQIEKHMLADTTNDGKADQSLKLNVDIVSATRFSENDFWSKSALGLSLKRHLKQDARLSAKIAFENSRGLSEVFNDCIDQAGEDAILIFIHDDVWIDEANFTDAVVAGFEHFDVIGVAGNRRRLPNQPAWAFIDNQFTWDDKSNLSGHIAHGKSAFGKGEEFGTVPAECELLDGVFLAARKSSLTRNNVRFDAQFDFHFYDMDFCRSARQAGLRLGTWLLKLTHQSAGAFGSQHWREKYQRYLNKWEVASVNNDITFPHHENTERERNLQQAINEVLQMALEHQNAGQIEQAEHLYQEILNIQPKHAEANHNLGVIEAHLKGALAALPRLEVAVQEKPENEQFWVSYIDALMQSGATDSAVDALVLGQKYGLRSETAKTLAAEFVKELEVSHSCDFEYKEKMKIHLGCGTNYIKGWLNVDLDSPLADEYADFRNPLPYADASADYIFNEHFLEHITREEGLAFLKECRRVLKIGGIFRVSTPDLRWLAAQYSSGKLDEWGDVGWVPETSCRLLNEGMRRWGHQFVYDLPELSAILREAGFSDVYQVKYRESSCHELAGLECRPWHQELIVEAR